MEGRLHTPRDHVVNQHHVLFDRAAWRSSDARKDMRENRWLIVPLWVEAHKELHKAVEIVPVLDYHTIARVRRDYEPTPGNFVRSIEDFCLEIDAALEHPRTSQLQRDVGALAIHAIELQLPFIEEGLVWRRAA
jgi:hypothetical protein